MKALTFTQFINEAYVDSKGNLQDFELEPHEEYEIDMYDHIEELKEFLMDSGARDLTHDLMEGDLKFEFTYYDEKYSIHIDLDEDRGMAIHYSYSGNEPTIIYNGQVDQLIDLLKYKGLDFLSGGY